MVVWGSILGGSALVFLALTVGALIWGVGILSDRLPAWVNGGKKMVGVTIMKAEEILPGIRGQLKQIAPGLTETVEKMIPGVEIPAKDVGGEDIKPIPRHANMVRASFSMENQKRTVSYKGKVDFGTAKDFYRKKMLALGFQEKALRAFPEEEVYQFKKGSQELEFTLKKIGVALSELTIREL
jgi:hypothetical protein